MLSTTKFLVKRSAIVRQGRLVVLLLCRNMATGVAVQQMRAIEQRIRDVATACCRDPSLIKLVPVSKTKPSEAIMELYSAHQKVFGENYVQELISKAKELPGDIKWHFIGHLQTSNVNRLIREVPNLNVVETVDSVKLANKLNHALSENMRPSLDVYVQVHTSNEDTKHGVSPNDALPLAQHIVSNCPLLRFRGLMTIGEPDNYECFDVLARCRSQVAEALQIDEHSLELSMGMSGDFEEAIRRGSTSVRIGSTIFGARDYSKST